MKTPRPPHRMPPFLTKSKFLGGTQCRRLLWLDVNRRDLKPPPTPAQQMIFDQGHDVGEAATRLFPEGEMVDHEDFMGAVRHTRALIESGADVIFEATFAEDRLYARVDILRRTEGGWDLIEVKSSTKVKAEHVLDVAFQASLLERAGIPVTGLYLMHVDNSFEHPNQGELLVMEDISEDVAGVRPSVGAAIPDLLEVIDGPMPVVPIGPQCDKPYECTFKSVCWPTDLPKANVFTLPRAGAKAFRLFEAGCRHACDAGDHIELTATQASYVEVLKKGEPLFDVRAIRAALSELEYPLHFLDFETIALAVPRFDGVRPYQKVPYQFSCHTVPAPGAAPEHSEHLHEDESDPRATLARQLVDSVGPNGSVVVYNASFERGVLEDLAAWATERDPDLAERLLGIRDRLWDLLPVIRNHVEHPDFLGSNSIKNVLPALCPDLSYSGMEVANGQDAGAMWLRLIDRRGDHYWEGVRRDLLEYCRLDTLGMVRIVGVLEAKAQP